MPHAVTAIADDLTGACELAGAGLRHGLSAVVTLDSPTRDGDTAGADAIVYDTETRLQTPLDAARRLTALGSVLSHTPAPALLYKKTDSALRGPIVAELEALALSLRRDRILLVPANPALGRKIVNGHYTIDGVPLPATPFGRDPHHPARSSAVLELLTRPHAFQLRSLSPGDTVPLGTLVIGDTATAEDMAEWARHLPANTLAAGGGAFFSALLASHVTRPTPAPSVSVIEQDRAVLVLSGTTMPQKRAGNAGAAASGEMLTPDTLEDSKALAEWLTRIEAQLQTDRRAVVTVAGPVVPDTQRATRIRSALAAVAFRAVQRGLVQHLVVEGGSTAAAVASALGWRTLHARHEWSPGVVSLSPAAAPSRLFTVKPGSYPWPAELAQTMSSLS